MHEAAWEPGKGCRQRRVSLGGGIAMHVVVAVLCGRPMWYRLLPSDWGVYRVGRRVVMSLAVYVSCE